MHTEQGFATHNPWQGEAALLTPRQSGATAGSCLLPCARGAHCPRLVPSSQHVWSRPTRHRAKHQTQAIFSTMEATMKAQQGNERIKVLQLDQPRSKRVVGEVYVAASVEEVWEVLTDYEELPTFVPNLDTTERVPGAPPGRVWLKQRGCSQSLFWRLQATATLELREVQRPLGRRELRFHMVEGDFQEFTGQWVVEPATSNSGTESLLRYEISIAPKVPIPASVVTQIVKCGLPANLNAVANRAEGIARGKPTTSGEAQAEAEVSTRQQRGNVLGGSHQREQMPAKGPPRPPWPTVRLQPSAKWRAEPPPKKAGHDYLGLDSVPLPALRRDVQPNSGAWEQIIPTTADAPMPGAGILTAGQQRLQTRQALQASYPAFDLGNKRANLEVHLRRLDREDRLHRRAVAAVNVNASVEDVWAVLTDYEHLAEFIPNLALCEQLELPHGAPPRFTRLRQVGYKNMQWMILHAEAVMDLVERPFSEIQFRQHIGDFNVLQGKWMLNPVEPLMAGTPQRERTQLKYAVEVQIPQSTPMLGLLEPLLERVVYEDLPSNMLALKARVEQLYTSKVAEGKKPSGSDMIQDFSLLASELEQLCGSTKTIPSRQDLRAMNRNDIEKAMAGHGGPSAVAQRLGWDMKQKAKKPRGWWDDIENIRFEVDEYARLAGLPEGVMPAKTGIVGAGRHDLARAIERWGGIYDLADALGYEAETKDRYSSGKAPSAVRHAGRKLAAGKDQSTSEGDVENRAEEQRHADSSRRGLAKSVLTKEVKDKTTGTKLGQMRREIDNW